MELPSDEVIRDIAVAHGVCVRPVLRRVTDRESGQSTVVAMACGSTLESRCPPCARKAVRMRMAQCAEGWHLAEEPRETTGSDSPVPDAASADDTEGEQAQANQRRVRSTRRLDGMPELPHIPVADRTIGKVFTGKDGTTYRPSMFITLTLPSYGKVRRGRGVPVRLDRYDYRRAALDALLFPRLMDRWFQNLRRAAGYRVQYFGAIEAQRRLAPHFHTAIRGAIPRATVKAVTAGTYLALWWPQCEVVVYDQRTPIWADGHYRDPDSGYPLPTWDEALHGIDVDPEAEPTHVLTFGRQVDVKGIVGGSKDSDRAVRYLTKYLTKSVAETYTDEDHMDSEYEDHIDRLHEQVRWLPCSPACANWLRYGVQPHDPGPGLVPGHCASKAHDREHLGLGGRRVLVSRGWSGKTLSEHKTNRTAVVRATLEAAGIQPESAERMAADLITADGRPRFVWEQLPLTQGHWAAAVTQSLRQHHRWQEQYKQAKALVTGAGAPVDSLSATQATTTTVAA